jgi:hypothetical protein
VKIRWPVSFVRNSETIDVLLGVIADPAVSLRAVGFAGRGITADVAGTMWTLGYGKVSLGAFELADRLMERGDLDDRLTELCLSLASGASQADFEEELERIVVAIESSPRP